MHLHLTPSNQSCYCGAHDVPIRSIWYIDNGKIQLRIPLLVCPHAHAHPLAPIVESIPISGGYLETHTYAQTCPWFIDLIFQCF